MRGHGETALIVKVPESEPLVEPFRKKFDPSAAVGVPAHITILYPFKPLSELTKDDFANLASLFAHIQAFPFSLTTISRFPGVLYLAPDPERYFKDMTMAVTAAYPDYPPYKGAFPIVIPHLTVADTDREALPSIEKDFARACERGLPVASNAESVWLLADDSGFWHDVRPFALGKGRR